MSKLMTKIHHQRQKRNAIKKTRQKMLVHTISKVTTPMYYKVISCNRNVILNGLVMRRLISQNRLICKRH